MTARDGEDPNLRERLAAVIQRERGGPTLHDSDFYTADAIIADLGLQEHWCARARRPPEAREPVLDQDALDYVVDSLPDMVSPYTWGSIVGEGAYGVVTAVVQGYLRASATGGDTP